MFFIRVLLLFILFFLLIRLIGRVLFGITRNSANSSGNNRNFSKKKEGEISIDRQPSDKKKIIKKEEGEYVKYEEIKDE